MYSLCNDLSSIIPMLTIKGLLHKHGHLSKHDPNACGANMHCECIVSIYIVKSQNYGLVPSTMSGTAYDLFFCYSKADNIKGLLQKHRQPKYDQNVVQMCTANAAIVIALFTAYSAIARGIRFSRMGV
jgi:hypothetical protein